MDEENKIPPDEIPQEQPVDKDSFEENDSTAEPITEVETTASDESDTEADQLSTINSQLSTEEMEVHHHTHPGHHKKKWTDYFWEFLMLFLAVFCGFLAEYQLEHVIEHQREKVFIASMVEDLQSDHEQLNRYINGLKLGLSQMDSMVTLLNEPITKEKNAAQIYYFGRISPRLQILTNNSRTFDQLKNSGGFRLIRNSNASNKIMGYYGSLQFIRHLEDLYFREFDEYKKIASKIFEPSILRSMELADGIISRANTNQVLRTNNPELLKELGVFAIYMNGSRRSIIPAALALQQHGDELIKYLNETYH